MLSRFSRRWLLRPLLESIWESFWRFLGPLWPHSGALWRIFGSHMASFGAPEVPKQVEFGTKIGVGWGVYFVSQNPEAKGNHGGGQAGSTTAISGWTLDSSGLGSTRRTSLRSINAHSAGLPPCQ